MNIEKSEQIKAGLQKSFKSGNSAKASTSCYGYKVTSDGELLIYPAEAIIVIHIFDRFAAGDSLGKISASLVRLGVKSPTGKDVWSRETIAKILNNEKYLGDVVLGKTQTVNGVQVKATDNANQTVIRSHHEAIISEELFADVQREKQRRSRAKNVVKKRATER